MNPTTSYFIAVNASMLVFYLLHSILIKKDTHFKQHRIYLLFALVVSLIIPFLSTFFTVRVESSTAVVLLNTVNIGATATIGAGSVITSTVEDDQLAIARSKQRNLTGWKRPVKK